VGSIYRHNEGGAPLAVAECALKLGGFRTALVDGIREHWMFLLADWAGMSGLFGFRFGLA
jgi:hypothetical protein